MFAQLAPIALTQGGVFTLGQARAVGFRWPALRQLLSPHGDWIVVRRGVYCEREQWAELDEYVGRPLARAWAAHLAIAAPHVMSHDSAAYAWGLPLLRPAVPLMHITRPGVSGGRTEHGIKHHLERNQLPVFERGGLPVTGLERTAVDIAREHGWLAGVVALDGALRLGADPATLEAVIAGMWCWPRVRQTRRAAELAMLGAESPGETLARTMVLELGLGDPITQFPVAVRDGVAWCDLLVGCHVFEFDGRRKYLDVSEGGDAALSPTEIVWAEKLRESDVTAQGLGMSRVFWRDCLGAGRKAGLARMAAEYTATVRRLGSSPPDDVVAFADQLAHRRDERLRRGFLWPVPMPVHQHWDRWRPAG